MSDFLLSIMFLRIILLVRSLFNFTMYTDLYATKLCDSYGFTANARFTFKCFILRYPLITMIGIFVISVLTLAYILRIFEIPYYIYYGWVDFNEYFTAIWCIIITMTSVGYGDVVPGSMLG